MLNLSIRGRATLHFYLSDTPAVFAQRVFPAAAQVARRFAYCPFAVAFGAVSGNDGPRPDGQWVRYAAARVNVSASSRILPSIVLQLLHNNPLTQLPHEVGPWQHEWSWSTASLRLVPVARLQMAHLPPWLSRIAAYSAAVMEYTWSSRRACAAVR